MLSEPVAFFLPSLAEVKEAMETGLPEVPIETVMTVTVSLKSRGKADVLTWECMEPLLILQ